MEAVELDATGTYLFVLRPGDDGWRIVTDMWRQHASQSPQTASARLTSFRDAAGADETE